MNNYLDQLLQKPIRLLNHANQSTIFTKENNPLASFAIDDAIATAVSKGEAPPTCRIWVHDPTIVLGIPDGRLPFLQDGVSFLQSQGYQAIIRNSGGLAVALDPSVINLSIIVPHAKEVSIDDGYQMMYQFIQKLLEPWTDRILAYEIVGSYCPGDYDLSIDGKKFAGISQRRVRDGVAVQIYLDVDGDAQERARLVRDFYSISKKNVETTYSYPEVNPDVMGSINELLATTFTASSFIEHIKSTLTNKSPEIMHHLLASEEEIFNKRYEQMVKRNEKILSHLD